jgi:hypothetical protein
VGRYPGLAAKGAAAAILVLLESGCRKAPPPPPSEEAPPAAAPAPDRIGPGQLIEGNQELLGLRLPEKAELDAVFKKSGEAHGPFPLEDLAAYVQARTNARHAEMAGGRIVFPRVTVTGQKRLLRIELELREASTFIHIRDITPPPTEPGLSEAERWRRAGFHPDGRPLDPESLR